MYRLCCDISTPNVEFETDNCITQERKKACASLSTTYFVLFSSSVVAPREKSTFDHSSSLIVVLSFHKSPQGVDRTTREKEREKERETERGGGQNVKRRRKIYEFCTGLRVYCRGRLRGIFIKVDACHQVAMATKLDFFFLPRIFIIIILFFIFISKFFRPFSMSTAVAMVAQGG